ncbi:G-protein coupled receptor 157-like [Dendronephthya gigantea]|uniref:G-protein coupled receptor 157-like n=1 Tax=Dendronephthya gigantea TaxID=151771 RepID=UPI00106D8D78|nr:G-protein coupled receptor 157-like [Dendronephthya gigantea]XP_028412581.1 G-protein coupled receptor 157-like [Dendronephthya gigantea]
MRRSAVLVLLFLTSALGTSGTLNEDEPTTTSSSKGINPFLKTYDRVIFTIISSLSAFGSIAIIVTYFLWRDLQTTTRRILVYISIGDFFATYTSLVIFWKRQFGKNDFSCQLQSFVTSTAIMWSFFWTTSLAIYLYIALVKKRHDISEKLMVVFHVINWLLPVILVGAAWYENELGTTGNKSTAGWCWIRIGKSHKTAVVWMFITGKFWEIISYFINGIMYYFIISTIKREVKERMHLMSTQSIQIALQGRGKLSLVPIIFVILRIWGTIRFILFAASANPPHVFREVMVTLQIIGDNAQGITNFILFCLLTEKFKQQIIRVFGFCNRLTSKRTVQDERTAQDFRRTFSDDTYKFYS